MSEKATIALVSVEGDLDVTTAPGVRDRIERLLAEGCRRVVVNMGAARHVDSAGLGVILSELRRMRGRGGLLSLINVSPQVYRALCRMRVLDYLPVSQAGARREVTALDPTALPCWRTTFRVEADGLAAARERLQGLVRAMPFSADEEFDLVLACGEALGNAVDHTCGDGVLVTVAAYPDRVSVDVADCGRGFEPADGTPEVRGDAERGRGIRLMHLLADSVTIRPKSSGEGTVVSLVKLFPRAVAPPAAPEGATALR